MLRKALSVLSNVLNKLPDKILCHTCVFSCYFFVFFFPRVSWNFRTRADEVCGLAHVPCSAALAVQGYIYLRRAGASASREHSSANLRAGIREADTRKLRRHTVD